MIMKSGFVVNKKFNYSFIVGNILADIPSVDIQYYIECKTN